MARDSHLVFLDHPWPGARSARWHTKGVWPAHGVTHSRPASVLPLSWGASASVRYCGCRKTVPCALPETPCALRIADMQDQGQINALFDAALREQQRGDDHSDRGLRSYADLIGITLRRQMERSGQYVGQRGWKPAEPRFLSAAGDTGILPAEHGRARLCFGCDAHPSDACLQGRKPEKLRRHC